MSGDERLAQATAHDEILGRAIRIAREYPEETQAAGARVGERIEAAIATAHARKRHAVEEELELLEEGRALAREFERHGRRAVERTGLGRFSVKLRSQLDWHRVDHLLPDSSQCFRLYERLRRRCSRARRQHLVLSRILDDGSRVLIPPLSHLQTTSVVSRVWAVRRRAMERKRREEPTGLSVLVERRLSELDPARAFDNLGTVPYRTAKEAERLMSEDPDTPRTREELFEILVLVLYVRAATLPVSELGLGPDVDWSGDGDDFCEWFAGSRESTHLHLNLEAKAPAELRDWATPRFWYLAKTACRFIEAHTGAVTPGGTSKPVHAAGDIPPDLPKLTEQERLFARILVGLSEHEPMTDVRVCAMYKERKGVPGSPYIDPADFRKRVVPKLKSWGLVNVPKVGYYFPADAPARRAFK